MKKQYDEKLNALALHLKIDPSKFKKGGPGGHKSKYQIGDMNYWVFTPEEAREEVEFRIADDCFDEHGVTEEFVELNEYGTFPKQIMENLFKADNEEIVFTEVKEKFILGKFIVYVEHIRWGE